MPPSPVRVLAPAAALVLVLALLPAPATAHSSFSCPGGYFLTFASGDGQDEVPDVHDQTFLTINPVPTNLESFRVRAFLARGNVQDPALQVAAWHDWDGSVGNLAQFHVYVQAGAALVKVIIDECMGRNAAGDVVPMDCNAAFCSPR